PPFRPPPFPPPPPGAAAVAPEFEQPDSNKRAKPAKERIQQLLGIPRRPSHPTGVYLGIRRIQYWRTRRSLSYLNYTAMALKSRDFGTFRKLKFGLGRRQFPGDH